MKKCFVMMPSGKHNEYEKGTVESDFIYARIIRPAVVEALGNNVEIIREADRRLPGAISKEIVKHTIEADLAIVDITGQNPNVFFELGMRYALRRNCTILIRQTHAVIPFDISAYRSVYYDPHFRNDEQSKIDLVDAIKSALAEKESRSDSLVFDVFPDLYVEIPGVLLAEGEAASSRQMRWPEYWQQIKKIGNAIRDHFQNGRYVPSVVIAISNGGMMYADLLGRELFPRVPITTLWANRWSTKGEYFSDEINHVTIEGIKKMMGDDKPEVLLVDDIVATGYTIVQALNFIKCNLPNSNVSFMPLFCKNEKYLDNIRENILWFKPPFKFTDEEVIKMHFTDALMLPYEKEIRSS